MIMKELYTICSTVSVYAFVNIRNSTLHIRDYFCDLGGIKSSKLIRVIDDSLPLTGVRR